LIFFGADPVACNPGTMRTIRAYLVSEFPLQAALGGAGPSPVF